ncbi:MAG: BlaI/MecI/CopY family transcriptional regulator [Candidatus Latescibacterota bacterium]|jgi:predicted transcriptional regulator
MRKKTKNLSEIEMVLFKICINKGEVIVRDVYEEMLKTEPKNYMTIKTEMDRIVDKGYLRRRKLGPIFIYTPTISKSDFSLNSIEFLAEKVLDNDLSPMLTYFVKHKSKITDEELKQLKKLTENIEED